MTEGEQFSLIPEFEKAGFIDDQKNKKTEPNENEAEDRPIEKETENESVGEETIETELTDDKILETNQENQENPAPTEDMATEWFKKIKKNIDEHGKQDKIENKDLEPETRQPETRPDKKDEYDAPYDDIYPFHRNLSKKRGL